MAYPDLSRAVRSVDSLLRQRQHIQEFTDDDECIFRLSGGAAQRPVILSDGTAIAEGEPILQLHFWNEHLPVMPSAGPSAAWANQMKRRMRYSLAAVCRHIESDSQFDAVAALHGAPPFGSRLGAAQMVRTAERFGFDVLDPSGQPALRARIHEVFDSMLLWGLLWAFNPGGLRSKGLLRHRYQLWISRARLHAVYAGLDRAPPRHAQH